MRIENIRLAQRCRSLRAQRRLSPSELATLSGVSLRTLKRVELADIEDYDPKLSTVASIARGLGVEYPLLVN